MDNLLLAIRRFNNMHREIDLITPLGIARAKVVLNYGLNILKLYNDSGVLDEVLTKVISLNNILAYKV